MMTIKAVSFIIYISQNVTGKGSDGPGYARFRFGLHYCLPGQVEIFLLPGCWCFPLVLLNMQLTVHIGAASDVFLPVPTYR